MQSCSELALASGVLQPCCIMCVWGYLCSAKPYFKAACRLNGPGAGAGCLHTGVQAPGGTVYKQPPLCLHTLLADPWAPPDPRETAKRRRPQTAAHGLDLTGQIRCE